MRTEAEKRAVLLEWDREVSRAARLPYIKRPKREVIIERVCVRHGICRRTLFLWSSQLH